MTAFLPVSMALMTRLGVSRLTTPTSWAGSYAGTTNVTERDGPANRLPSLYECTVEGGITQEFIISAADDVRDQVGRIWTIHMWKESHIASKGGLDWTWKCQPLFPKARDHMKAVYVKVASMVIVRSDEIIE